MTATDKIIEDAKVLANDTGLSFDEALGQVYGGLVFSIDAVLHEQGSTIPSTSNSLFYRGMSSQHTQYFRDL